MRVKSAPLAMRDRTRIGGGQYSSSPPAHYERLSSVPGNGDCTVTVARWPAAQTWLQGHDASICRKRGATTTLFEPPSRAMSNPPRRYRRRFPATTERIALAEATAGLGSASHWRPSPSDAGEPKQPSIEHLGQRVKSAELQGAPRDQLALQPRRRQHTAPQAQPVQDLGVRIRRQAKQSSPRLSEKLHQWGHGQLRGAAGGPQGARIRRARLTALRSTVATSS